LTNSLAPFCSEAVSLVLPGAQVDFSTACVHRLDLARHDLALVVHGHEGREGIAVQLLDAQGDALALDVHGQHDGFDFLALLVVAHGGFAGCGILPDAGCWTQQQRCQR
jgi:hypothetical protein